ncbi:response regulator [Corallincola luteus]|uniref:response regulator n=1 Tax=Corallincola luteus TaxID=1775177 RepID=UPI001F0E0DF9|nr:response regulator [Corallincola luteus]
MKILIIDDDRALCELLAELLALDGYELTMVHDGKLGLAKARTTQFDLILLDVMLPGLNGMAVLKELRQHQDTPVLMLTARGEETDRVLGLEFGADDYLPKPFSDRELLARMRAILRRTNVSKSDEPTSDRLSVGELSLYPGRQEAKWQDERLDLTSTEFALLLQLVKAKGEILSKDYLNQAVLGRALHPFDRSLDVHVSNLRKKLPQRSDESDWIRTVRGKGYLWMEQY